MSKQRPLTKNKNKQNPWANSPKPWHGSGFYGELDLNKLDNRTNVAKAVKSLRAALKEYVGTGNIASDLLISQIIYKAIKLHFYTSSCLQDLQNVESPHFLPLSNSLRLDLNELQKQVGESKPPSLDEYLQGLEEAGK